MTDVAERWIKVSLSVTRADDRLVIEKDADLLADMFVEVAESRGFELSGSFSVEAPCRICEAARATGDDGLCNGCRAAVVEKRCRHM